MKYLILIFISILLLLNVELLKSQNIDNTLIKEYKLDFSVPDNPSLKILGTETSKLLKPSSNDIISFIASELFNLSSISLPKSYAAEISPLLLFNQNTTIKKYQDNEILYTIRISIASSRNDKNVSKFSAGARISLIDKGYLITDNEALNKLNEILKDKLDETKQLENSYEDSHPNFRISDLNQIKEREDYIQSLIGNKYKNRIDSTKKAYEDNKWNKMKLDIAYAMLGQSPDTTLNRVRFTDFSFWTTFSNGISTWCQYLFGINANYNSINKKSDFYLNSRLFAGINKAKGFIEAQYSHLGIDQTHNLFINLGAELSITSGLWAEYYAGLNLNNIGPNITRNFESHFDLRFGLP